MGQPCMSAKADFRIVRWMISKTFFFLMIFYHLLKFYSCVLDLFRESLVFFHFWNFFKRSFYAIFFCLEISYTITWGTFFPLFITFLFINEDVRTLREPTYLDMWSPCLLHTIICFYKKAAWLLLMRGRFLINPTTWVCCLLFKITFYIIFGVTSLGISIGYNNPALWANWDFYGLSVGGFLVSLNFVCILLF